MVRRRAAAVLVTAISIGAACLGEAQTTNATIVVTARREWRDLSEVPAHVTVLTSENLRDLGGKTVADALTTQSGLLVRSVTGTPATTDVSMRGFGENAHGRVLVLLDGRPVNRPDMATINWLQFPLSAVERIEIVRGSASSLYGDHAVGGVVNIITRKGEAAPTEATVELGSFGYNAERFSAGVAGKGLGLSVHAERLYTDGYRDRSAFLSQGLGIGLTWNAEEKLIGTLALSWQRVEYEMPGALTREEMQQNPRMAKNQADEALDRYLNGELTIQFEPLENHRFELKAVAGRTDVESDTFSFNIFPESQIESAGLFPTYAWHGELFGRENRLMIGVDRLTDRLDYNRYSDQPRSGAAAHADLEKTVWGGHVRDECELIKSLTLGLAGRVEQARFKATIQPLNADGFGGEKDFDEQAWEVALNWRFDKASKLFVRWGTTYRYPFVDELVSYQGFGDAFYTDLEPEEGWTTEIGFECGLPGDICLGVTAFRLELTDEIAYNMATYRNENLDATRRMGIEAEASWRFGEWGRIYANYTLTEAQFTGGPNDGKTVPLVPEHKGSLGWETSLPQEVKLNLVATAVGDCYLGGDYGHLSEKLDGYVVVDAVARWSPRAVKGLSVHLAVENLFDKSYASYGFSGMGWGPDSFYPAPGRGIRGGLSYRF
ncbi:MAG: TonB-dependent receptor [Kiritimatiellia bacterium]